MNIFIYGLHTVEYLIKYKYTAIDKLFFLENKNRLKFLKLINLSKKKSLKFFFVKKNYFKKIFKEEKNHQGVIAIVKKKFLFNKNEFDLLNFIKNLKNVKILVLDHINDPFNLGSCIRTAVSAGINVIIVSKYKSVSIMNSIVHKTSCGTIYKCFILEVNNLFNIVKLLKDKYNFYVIGASNKSSSILYDFDFCKFKSLILIIGSEKNGIRKNLIKYCDFLLNIPLKNGIDSLNLSVANGIFLFEILRQTKFNKIKN